MIPKEGESFVESLCVAVQVEQGTTLGGAIKGSGKHDELD
jgi:hypothetical protein